MSNKEELFKRILWAADHTEMSVARRLSHMHTTLVLICHEGLRDSRHSFGSLFAQVDFLCRHLHLTVSDTIEVQRMRRDTNGIRPDGGPSEEDVLYGCRALAVLLSAVACCDIPSALVGKIPATGRMRPDSRHIDWRHLRCVAVRDGEEERGANADDADVFRLRVRMEDGDTSRHVCISSEERLLLHIIRDGMQLSLVDVHEEADGTLAPRFIVVEPDYLLDISSVAHCFTDYGHHPLSFFVNMLAPVESSQAILLGNYAGKVLDAALRTPTPGADLWRDTLREHFAEEALGYATCDDFNPHEYKTLCQRQARNIIDIVSELRKTGSHHEDGETAARPSGSGEHGSAFLLEPSFVCPALGFQGRVDLMTDDMLLLVEQKSGKNFNLERHVKGPHGAYQREDHYVQLLLYFAVLHHNFSVAIPRLDLRLMYSRYPLPDGLLAVGYYHTLLREAVMLRNRIVASAMYFAREGFTPEILRHITPAVLNERGLDNMFYKKYILPRHQHVIAPLHAMSPLETAYFCRMVTFLYREQAVGCLGVQEGTTHGMSDIWNMPYSEKTLQGDIMVCPAMEVGEGYVHDVTLRRADSREVNFRNGDGVMLYRFRPDAVPDATKAVLYKGVIVSVTPHAVEVHLTDPQPLSRQKGEEEGTWLWAVEHNYSSSGTASGLRALYLLMSCEKERRDLLLGQRKPRHDTSVTLSRTYHAAYDDVVLHAMQAQDYYLLVGPPGTGKTSMAMRFIVQEEMERMKGSADSCGILLTSYTNRAVDEICAMLSSAEIPFLRIGSPYTCDKAYHDRLASTLFANDATLERIRQRVATTPVVVATTSTLMSRQQILAMKTFSLTVVDEASQILEPDIIGLLARLGKFVLIGDNKQLPAVVQQPPCDSVVEDPLLLDIALFDCRNSLFERLLCYVAEQDERGATPCLGTLHYQGRMHPGVASWPDGMFYKDEDLRPVPLPHQEAERPYDTPACGVDSLAALLLRERMLFFDIQPDDTLADSKSNLAEAVCCGEIVRCIAAIMGDGFDARKSVGIIVPYRNQISLIRNEIVRCGGESYADSVTIDTVERFQGSQRDVIIFSCTVSQRYQLEFLTSNTFLARQRTSGEEYPVDRKLNVAMTRARKQMIVVGNAPLLSIVPIYRSLIEHCHVVSRCAKN